MLRRRHLAGAAIALVAALGSAIPGAATIARSPMSKGASHPASHPALPDRLLVKFRPGAPRAQIHRQAGTKALRTLNGLTAWDLVALPAGLTPPAAASAYRRLPGVAHAEPVYVAGAQAQPDDPCIARACPDLNQWNLYTTRVPLAWDAFPGRTHTAAERLTGDPVMVAVLDTQIDATHPDWINSGGAMSDASEGGQLDLSSARSWVTTQASTGAAAYHGTYVAGILAAAAGNGRDIAGVGYNSMVVPLTVLDGSGKTDAASLAEAITYARQIGARVMNLSLGMEADSQAVHDAIVAATAEPGGALIVAAAGNNTKDRPFYPGSYPEVMSVAGIDSTERPASCSNYNANVSVAAPARHVLSLAPMPQRLRVVDCGTSAAAPHVCGVAALLFGQDPSRTAAQVRQIIEGSATDDSITPGRDDRFGFGILNADRALHTGIGPGIEQLATTLATRGDSSSTITATARSENPITAAEAYLDRPGSDAARVEMQPADGAWGGTTERLVATIAVPAAEPDAAHAVYVRAKDTAWGAAERGKLSVDRSAPEIVNVRAGNAIRTRQSTVSFGIRDAHSSRFTYSISIMGPDGSVVWQTPSVPCPAGPQAGYWTPAATVIPGPHRVEIWVWDEAGNPAATSTTILVT